VKAGTILPVIGHFGGLSGAFTVDLTLDGNQLLSAPGVLFTSGTFNLSPVVPGGTTQGTHELCATAQGIQKCTEIIVCTIQCFPRLGFLGEYGIASSSISVQSPPQSQFTVVGDDFFTGDAFIWIDSENNILGTAPVPSSGRFVSTLTLPHGESYGSHTITAAGSTIQPNPSGDIAYATLEIVRFVPE
jgi:hypothetical protein